MKKTVILLLAALMGAVSCTKFAFNEGSQVYSRDYQVKPSEWKKDTEADPPFFWVSYSNPDITAEVAKGRGAVTGYVYLIYDTAKKLGSWNPLPYIYPYRYQYNEGYSYLPESFRFDWEEGQVTFVIQDMDGFLPDDMTDNLLFRVTVVK